MSGYRGIFSVVLLEKKEPIILPKDKQMSWNDAYILLEPYYSKLDVSVVRGGRRKIYYTGRQSNLAPAEVGVFLKQVVNPTTEFVQPTQAAWFYRMDIARDFIASVNRPASDITTLVGKLKTTKTILPQADIESVRRHGGKECLGAIIQYIKNVTKTRDAELERLLLKAYQYPNQRIKEDTDRLIIDYMFNVIKGPWLELEELIHQQDDDYEEAHGVSDREMDDENRFAQESFMTNYPSEVELAIIKLKNDRDYHFEFKMRNMYKRYFNSYTTLDPQFYSFLKVFTGYIAMFNTRFHDFEELFANLVPKEKKSDANKARAIILKVYTDHLKRINQYDDFAREYPKLVK